MALVGFEPEREISRLEEQINRWFNQPQEGGVLNGENGYAFESWSPGVDIFEDSERFVIQAELPGMNLENIDLRVVDHQLTIEGERKFEGDEKRERYHRVEGHYGPFKRAFTLPPTIDHEKISAAYDRGVLKVVLPKKEETKPRKISIEVQS